MFQFYPGAGHELRSVAAHLHWSLESGEWYSVLLSAADTGVISNTPQCSWPPVWGTTRCSAPGTSDTQPRMSPTTTSSRVNIFQPKNIFFNLPMNCISLYCSASYS